MMNTLKDTISHLLHLVGCSQVTSQLLTFFLLCAIAAAATGILSYLLRRFLTPFIVRWTQRTQVIWDDYLLNPPVLNAVWHLLSSITFYFLLPY